MKSVIEVQGAMVMFNEETFLVSGGRRRERPSILSP